VLTELGKRMVMLDGAGHPRAVVETVELTQRRFNEVDAQFAFDEGDLVEPVGIVTRDLGLPVIRLTPIAKPATSWRGGE
jgi:hypothetical protein